MSFITPSWLLGLALLPLLRWLHRGGRHRRALPVSHLGLWRGAAASSPAAGERRPPDPAWRRRALFTALVFLALAGPLWPQPERRITLWLDDSPSMLTREAQGTRLALAGAQARALLAEVPHAEVELRRLSDPWRALGAPDDALLTSLAAEATAAGQRAPAPPPAALLTRDRAHWLLTDGAHPALLAWPDTRQADRIIQVGSASRNVGLQRLAARRRPGDPGRLDLLIGLANGGPVAESRTLVLVADGVELLREVRQLEAGAALGVQASVPASAISVRATLEPGDALAEDDQMRLDLVALARLRVATDAQCPVGLRTAVAAHPALALVAHDAGDAQAVLACTPGTPGTPERALPTLRAWATHTAAQPRGTLRWSSTVPGSRRLVLDADRLTLAARLAPGPLDEVLLALGDEPALVGRAQRLGGAQPIDAALDFDAMAAAAGPELPLLLNWIFEQLLGRPLLDALATTERAADAVRVAPAASASAAASDPAPHEARVARHAAWGLLAAALAVLLWEILALAQQWRRLDGRRGAGNR